MAERFRRRQGVARAIRRIARAEIDVALAAIRDGNADETEVIHTVRQQLKRLRALLRLPRPYFPDYRAENAALRDIARRLAGTRDADVLAETFDGLAEEAGLASAAELRLELLPAQAPSTGSRQAMLTGEIRRGLVAARRRVKDWRFDAHGFALIGRGLERVYRDMRDGEALARHEPTALHFHEWRKQTKYHANQLAMLRAVSPPVFKGYRKLGDRLAATLGDHHDLDVLAGALGRLESVSESQRQALDQAIAARDAALAQKAFRLGDELGAERPADFLRRVHAGWKAWRA